MTALVVPKVSVSGGSAASSSAFVLEMARQLPGPPEKKLEALLPKADWKPESAVMALVSELYAGVGRMKMDVPVSTIQ